ncbi:MAG TPA: CHASE3 domain-containing protein [Pseudolabrys sp.]|nr:CHASE3 domain-containing protein [Pseudolabrys sp.]
MPWRKPLFAIDQSKLQPILLGIAFAVLVAISITTAFVVNRAGDDAENLNHTLQIQDRLTNVLLIMRRAESGQRGYLLTGRTDYLTDYSSAAPRIGPSIDELRQAVGDDPALKPTVEKIETLSRPKIEEMARTIDMAQRGDRAGALELVASDVGRNTMEEVRQTVAEAVAAQRMVRTERAEISDRTNNVLLFLTIGGSLFVVAIGAVSIFLVRRNARRAEIARQELAGTNANLERIVEYRTADLTEANEEIQRFAYIVSHDLRSPLVNIMGFTSELEALRQDIFAEVERLRAEVATLKNEAEAVQDADTTVQLGRDFDEAIGFIKTSIANMDRLINAVLRLSREGRRQFNPEQVDMDALISGIVETVSHRAAELSATLRVEALPPVETDLLAAQQIFGNLIDNALKYGRDDEKLQIDIRGRLTATHAIYDVQDNGRGIDPADFQRVFELFRRAGKQDRPGEGIGLAHVRALVRRMGGTMGLNSEPGKGSTFTVTLPRRWAGDKRSAA